MYLRKCTHEAYIYDGIDIYTHKLIFVKISMYAHINLGL